MDILIASKNFSRRTCLIERLFHGHHHDNFCYEKLTKKPQPFAITNVGFRSIADIDGNYLLKTIDDRH